MLGVKGSFHWDRHCGGGCLHLPEEDCQSDHRGVGGREWRSSLRMTGGHLVVVVVFFCFVLFLDKKLFISGVLI